MACELHRLWVLSTLFLCFAFSGIDVAFALQATPSSLTFAATQGSSNPPSQSVGIALSRPNEKRWTASSDAVWLTLVSKKTQLTASVNTSNLAPGTYLSSVSISVLDNSVQSTILLPVTLTVSASSTSTGPILNVSPVSLGFSGTVGNSNPSAQAVNIGNTGGGTLTWTATEALPWLTLSPSSGTNTGSLTAMVNLVGLAAGTYTGTISVNAAGASTQNISVALTVASGTTATTGTPSVSLAPTTLGFTATAGGTNPASKTLAISNTTGGTLTWTLSDDAAWLTTNIASGTTTTEVDSITANVNTAGLASGTYSATITVTPSGGSLPPKTIPVTLSLSTPSTASSILAWNANTESDIAGYKVYRSTASGTYGSPVATIDKSQTSYTAAGLLYGTTYFFVVTAYDTAGNESPFSVEVSKSIF